MRTADTTRICPAHEPDASARRWSTDGRTDGLTEEAHAGGIKNSPAVTRASQPVDNSIAAPPEGPP